MSTHKIKVFLKCHDNTTEHFLRFQRISFKSETSIQLIDIAQHLSDFAIVEQFIQDNGINHFNSKIEQLQGRILRLHGYEPGDLLFEDVTLNKTVKYHIEIHSTE